MKPRHAAAVALVGWYLICPPLRFEHPENPSDTGKVLLDAPISEWVVQGSFDSAADCEQAKSEFRAQSAHWLLPKPSLVSAERLGKAFCIATDDPRLKRKWGIKPAPDFGR